MASRRCVLVLLVILAVSSLGAATARAQQPVPPDPAQLYAQMTVAMQQAGSVHIQLSTAALPTGRRQTVVQKEVGSADISSQQQLLHVVFTAMEASVQTHKVLVRQRTVVFAVDGRFAQRNDGGQWWCQALPAEYWQGPLTGFVYLPLTPHFIGGVTPATVLGVAVWRVKLDLENRIDVLNIAQNSYRLVRVTETRGVKTAADGQLKTYSDFSRYGESVTAQLPQACG
jgi:hypothetical protein